MMIEKETGEIARFGKSRKQKEDGAKLKKVEDWVGRVGRAGRGRGR
jgi:DNA helicase TIP49 (TBP-interacting protein)